MKTLRRLSFAMIIALAFASCGSNKQVVNNQPQQPTYQQPEQQQPQQPQQPQKPTTSNEPAPKQTPGETLQIQGTSMVDELSEDGLSIRQVAYKWYAGVGTADNKAAAIELAEREARAAISRVITNAVMDQAERGRVGNNGHVQEALTSHWKQVSASIANTCEPFEVAHVEYDQTTKMYTVTAKVGIRGDRFVKMINNAGEFKPSTLKGDELDQFIEVNKAIMEAAKGN